MISSRLVLVGLLVTVGGCVSTGEIGYDCDPSTYEEGHLGPDGKPDFCHRRDPPKNNDGCDSETKCFGMPATWQGPVYFWAGQAGHVPACPLGSNEIAWEGHADLVAPNKCEPCSCEPPSGACALSSTLTASMTACNVSGGSSSPFDAPESWGGQCDTSTQVPAGLAGSLTIAPLTLTESACSPGLPVAAKVIAPRWATDVRACHSSLFNGCKDTTSACFPSSPRSTEYEVCVVQNGDQECPSFAGSLFTEKHVAYQRIADDRQCSACTCGPPSGSLCTAMVSVYGDASEVCGGALLDQVTISSAGSKCFDIQPPGQGLGGKSAGPTTYVPGTCQPMGGDAVGSATASNPVTFCCHVYE